MTDSDGREVAGSVSAALREQAETLAAQWLDTLGADGSTDAMKALAADVIRAVAELSGDGGTDGAVAPSRALAKAWFGAGVNRPTGMKSIDALGDVLLAAAAASIEDVPEATSHAAFDVASRLHRELGTVATEMAISYDDSIAHELKNPLGAAKGAAELLQSGEGVETEEARAQFTALVLRNVNRTLALLDSVRGKTPNPGG
ncbi:hypothetical protein BH23GEM10_BH23GEM10_01310 [soil metagenome]